MSLERWWIRSTVHPRAVWGGTATALIGMVVIGALMMTPRPATAWLGVAIVVVGVAIAWWNGAMADIHARRPAREEIHDVRDGSPYHGVLPTDRHTERPAQDEALEVDRAARTAEARRQATMATTWLDLSQAAVGCVLLAAAALVVTAVSFHQDSSTHDATLRQTFAAIALALLAVRLLMVAATTATAALVAVVAAALIASVLVWWPYHWWLAVAGLVGGGVCLLAALTIIVCNVAPHRATAGSDAG